MIWYVKLCHKDVRGERKASPILLEDEMVDKSKHDYRDQLFLLQLAHRVTNRLCIYCGEVELLIATEGACSRCKEACRQKRIAEAGYDYYEDVK